jgi:hypothetical protein
VIHALDPSRMPSGTFERLIDVTGRLPDPGVVAETATISGLPEDFAINNATQSGDKWVVQLSKFDPNHFQIELRYVLPAEGTAPDANGILGDFTLNVTFKTHDSKGGLHLYAGTQIFVTREIGSEADVTASANGVGKMYALNATPPGTEISAGEGNDSVYAGPGHDTLDGGSGANLVSYAESSSGVMVDLFTGQGQGGYAEGDVLRNFSSIEGSAFADRLLGTAGDNNFHGHGGADTIIGNGGHDIVYFDASQEAVSVNLETGEVSGGPGSGSLLIGISDVVGSAVAGNTLIGTADANRPAGGSSADTIDGRGGADVIAAGRGDDRVSYYGTEDTVDGRVRPQIDHDVEDGAAQAAHQFRLQGGPRLKMQPAQRAPPLRLRVTRLRDDG